MHVTTAVQYFSSPSINDIPLTLKAKQTLCSRTAIYVLKTKTGHFKSKSERTRPFRIMPKQMRDLAHIHSLGRQPTMTDAIRMQLHTELVYFSVGLVDYVEGLTQAVSIIEGLYGAINRSQFGSCSM